MHYRLLCRKTKTLLKHRHQAAWVIAVLCAVCLMQGGLLYRMSTHQSTTLIPLAPQVTEPFTVSSRKLDSAYLADISRYFILLRLNYTPATLPHQIKTLLCYADARYYGAFKRQLSEALQRAQQESLSLAFSPTHVRVHPKRMSVAMTGVLQRFVGQEKVSQTEMTYEVQYRYAYGHLSVTRLHAVQEKDTANHAVN